MAVKVLALDVTPEEQKQIKAELEILHKVRVCRTEKGVGETYMMIRRKGGWEEGYDRFDLEGGEEGRDRAWGWVRRNRVFAVQCNSRHIIGFYGAFFSENRISICTEYMDGELYSS
jgi:serine/threonine protein kinase